MEEKNKLTEFLKRIVGSEATLRRIAAYFFVICILLIVMIFKLTDTNKYLRIISENGTNKIEYETRDNTFIEISSEEEKDISDTIPIIEEFTDVTEKTTSAHNTTDSGTLKESTSKAVIQETTTLTNSSANATTVTAKPAENDNVSRKSYVLNTSSKKIHYPDCSFVARMSSENKKVVKLSDNELKSYLNNGYEFCKSCGGK